MLKKSVNAQKLEEWPLFHICGSICLAIALLCLVVIGFKRIENSMIAGCVVSLPWLVMVLLARFTGKPYVKLLAIFLPLAIGFYFFKSSEVQNDPLAASFQPVAYFTTLYGLGWLCFMLFAVIVRSQGD